MNASYQVGQEILPHYKVTKAKPISALQAILYEVQHIPTKAKIMQIANSDQENTFCLNFMTLPSSHNGVAHILEHTVLCGSEKFPVKDPFFYMARRSLNTFMNAMTGSDFTCYPASSQIEKDFYNLLDVYLDAVFHPLLNKLSFLQEGHRLEFQNIKDPSSPLTFQGIVYNEMKGSLTSADSRLWHAMLKHLMPDLPYRFNSGGDPKEIPDLTYEEFLNFHQTYYHPSRCLFYFYGNIDLKKHLQFLDDKILKATKPASALPPLPKQQRFSVPVSFVTSYPTSDKDLTHKTFLAFSWLTAEIKNQEDVTALLLLDSILMDHDSSPLKYAIMQSGLCRACDAFIDVEMSEIPFSIFCRGTEKKHADALEKLIFDTLRKIVHEGLDPKLIESTLHQLEFSRLEIAGDYYPFGLSLFFRSALAFMHGCPPENALVVHELFEDLLQKLKDPHYLPNILKKYLLDNKHYLKLVMQPNPDLEQEEFLLEQSRLDAIKKSLSFQEKKQLIQQSQDLLHFQKESSFKNIETLPKIHLEDIPKKNTEYLLTQKRRPSMTSFHHECFTNHIIYVDIVMNLPKLSKRNLFLVKLFSYLGSELGVNNSSYIDQQKRLHEKTGGVHFSLASHPQHGSPDTLSPALHLKGKALSRNSADLFAIFKDLLTGIRLDEKERIKELILKLSTHKQTKLLNNSMSYAIDLALLSFSHCAKLHHLWHGVAYYKFIQDLAKNLDDQLDHLLDELKELQKILFHHLDLHIVSSCDKKDFDFMKKNCFPILENLPTSSYTPWTFDLDIDSIISQGRIIPSPVAFTCQGFKTIHQPHLDTALLCLASSIFDHKVLHKQIREIGGAYGGGSSFNTITGHFYMYSYRDPQLETTLKAFQEAIETVASGQFNTTDVEEAQLSLIQSLDSPVSPGSRASLAYAEFRENRTALSRQKLRDQILSATPEMIQKAVQNHLISFSEKATLVSFAGKKLLTKENEKLTDKLTLLEI